METTLLTCLSTWLGTKLCPSRQRSDKGGAPLWSLFYSSDTHSATTKYSNSNSLLNKQLLFCSVLFIIWFIHCQGGKLHSFLTPTVKFFFKK